MSILAISVHYYIKNSSHCNEAKGKSHNKERSKFPFSDDIIIYIENPQESAKQL